MNFNLGNHEVGIIVDRREGFTFRMGRFEDVGGVARDVQFGPVLIFWFARAPAIA